MTSTFAFTSVLPVRARPDFLSQSISAPIPCGQRPFRRPSSRRNAVTAVTGTTQPDAGLIPVPGTTGTFCANLYPVPIFGNYGWFLTVYDRDIAASVGPFVVRFISENIIHFFFRPGQIPTATDNSPAHAAFPGIAAGNLNVMDRLSRLGAGRSPHELRFFEGGGVQNFRQRRNELHLLPPEELIDEMNSEPLWQDIAPTYRIISRTSFFEVRELYTGAGAKPRNTPRFEHFSMNLAPIPFLKKHSAFVCVWRQQRSTSPIALDKRGKNMQLRVLDALLVPQEVEDRPPVIGKFAVHKFFGVVSDRIVTQLHFDLLASIEAAPSITAVSETDFRVVINNKPNTFTPGRRNEIWIEVE